jgi:ribosomal protein L28
MNKVTLIKNKKTSKMCALCGKGRMKVTRRVKTRSKFNPTKSYFQYPNLQWLKLKDGKRIKVCTKCRKKIINENLLLKI